MPAPLNEVVFGDVQNATGESVAAHAKATTTLLLFQPNAFGGGDTVALICGPLTANITPLLATPCLVTTTGPDEASGGTTVAMLVSLHVLMVDGMPLNVTTLAPCDAPKLILEIVTAWPIGPDAGATDEMKDCLASTCDAIS